MRPGFLATLLLVFFSQNAMQGADALYHREINQKNPGGKDLVMSFQELRRGDKTSEVKVTFVSGATVASCLFILRGFYDIARARSVPYFIKLKEWKDKDGGWMYLVGYSQAKEVDPEKYFALPEPLSKTDEHKFLAVRDFDLTFKARP